MRKFIRAVVPFVLAACLSALPGCTGMVQDELDATKAKLEELHRLVDSMNEDISILNSVVVELVSAESHSIVTGPIVETEDGYDITFRDGNTIHIHFGTDGKDGRTLIPVGVRDDEDGLYYWTVDGEWLLDGEGNRLRAGAVDGKDGIAPQFKVEEDYWWISTDGGENWEPLASCEEMNGVGVFKGINLDDPKKAVLILWDGTELEFARQLPFRLSFEGPVLDTVTVAAGETLSIPYKVIVEGETDDPLAVTAGTDGTYVPVLAGPDRPEGTVTITAPEPFTEGYILLSAYCSGYSAVKMISFREREVTPAEKVVTVHHAKEAGSKEVPYSANFEYTVSAPDAAWLEVVADPEAGTLAFNFLENESNEVRSCIVTVSPKDNPGYVCTTFEVYQATAARTYALEPGSQFAFDPVEKTLDVPSEGGDAVIRITFDAQIREVPQPSLDWVTAEMTLEDGFYFLKIHVDENATGEPRTGYIDIRRRVGNVFAPIAEHININQR